MPKTTKARIWPLRTLGVKIHYIIIRFYCIQQSNKKTAPIRDLPSKVEATDPVLDPYPHPTKTPILIFIEPNYQ
jgi:hypothetical protein